MLKGFCPTYDSSTRQNPTFYSSQTYRVQVRTQFMQYCKESALDDLTAIVRLKQGDIQSLETLVKKYQVEAVRTAYLITYDQAMAEDIVQASFLRVYQRIQQYDDSRPFRPWFLRVVANAALESLRREKRQVSLDQDVPSLEDTLADHAPYPDSEVEARELQIAVKKALEGLPPEQRAVIVLKYYGGLTESEMSETLATSVGTVKWRLHTARKQLSIVLHQFWTGGIFSL
jgi:RNA polymerase sigma-70 factor, ECF subfamily